MVYYYFEGIFFNLLQHEGESVWTKECNNYNESTYIEVVWAKELIRYGRELIVMIDWLVEVSALSASKAIFNVNSIFYIFFLSCLHDRMIVQMN